jgi:hypothetical protein
MAAINYVYRFKNDKNINKSNAGLVNIIAIIYFECEKIRIRATG